MKLQDFDFRIWDGKNKKIKEMWLSGNIHEKKDLLNH